MVVSLLGGAAFRKMEQVLSSARELLIDLERHQLDAESGSLPPSPAIAAPERCLKAVRCLATFHLPQSALVTTLSTRP